MILHECCAPCSTYPLKRLKEAGFNVHGYFFNPNIHPYTEFKLRLVNVIRSNETYGISSTIDNSYNLRQFLKLEQKDPANRCLNCYRLRLLQTAKFAQENGGVFTSTLLYSRRQNHDAILSIGKECATEYGCEFYYEDFRKGWQEGIDISRRLELYRQKYCGCIFSEEERYLGSIIKLSSQSF